MIFKNEKLNWRKWSEVFQDIEYFTPLINEIFEKSQLGKIENISNLTPGTNGVFKVNEYVVKIFVPDSVKPWDEDDFSNEKQNIKRAIEQKINTPRLIVEGVIEKRYEWNYLVLEHINASEVKNRISYLNTEDKINLAKQIRKIVESFNRKPIGEIDNQYIKERIISGNRWNWAKDKVKEQLKSFLNNIDLRESVYVHGDLTAENVLLDVNNNVFIIDFADCCIAPSYYEYPPIVFDLFNYDKIMINYFFGNDDRDEVIEELYKGILIHDFGGYIAKDMISKYSNRSLEDLDSLEEIKDIIRTIIIS